MIYTMKWISLGEPSIRTWFVSWVAASPTSIASLSMNSSQTKALTISYSVTTSISTIFSLSRKLRKSSQLENDYFCMLIVMMTFCGAMEGRPREEEGTRLE